jgi:hypothetical protein
MYESLLNAPSLSTLTKQRESADIAIAMKEVIASPSHRTIRPELRDKMHSLESSWKSHMRRNSNRPTGQYAHS